MEGGYEFVTDSFSKWVIVLLTNRPRTLVMLPCFRGWSTRTVIWSFLIAELPLGTGGSDLTTGSPRSSDPGAARARKRGDSRSSMDFANLDNPVWT